MTIRRETPDTRGPILTSIESGNMRIVSDGSYLKDKKRGAAGFIIEDEHRSFNIWGSISTPGEADVMCSHRSELSGILAAIRYILHTLGDDTHMHGTIILGCDGESGILAIEWSRIWHVKSSVKHFDLLAAIVHSMNLVPGIKWVYKHVRGHKEKLVEYVRLGQWAQLNVIADNVAKRRLTRDIRNRVSLSDVLAPFQLCSIQ